MDKNAIFQFPEAWKSKHEVETIVGNTIDLMSNEAVRNDQLCKQIFCLTAKVDAMAEELRMQANSRSQGSHSSAASPAAGVASLPNFERGNFSGIKGLIEATRRREAADQRRHAEGQLRSTSASEINVSLIHEGDDLPRDTKKLKSLFSGMLQTSKSKSCCSPLQQSPAPSASPIRRGDVSPCCTGKTNSKLQAALSKAMKLQNANDVHQIPIDSCADSSTSVDAVPVIEAHAQSRTSCEFTRSPPAKPSVNPAPTPITLVDAAPTLQSAEGTPPLMGATARASWVTVTRDEGATQPTIQPARNLASHFGGQPVIGTSTSEPASQPVINTSIFTSASTSVSVSASASASASSSSAATTTAFVSTNSSEDEEYEEAYEEENKS
uniref:Uncharacterized protein n=1 Tax=Haptolina brevifila TaxID=156173 RepID=A0A7S2GU75_9EUKA|mmetsp:Transcript_46094/g.91949  ORF Transcript_46094/g.91949 Transcript_46094/m.91949 type:complete len:382 (+) Transcript_46094:519-1664(+)